MSRKPVPVPDLKKGVVDLEGTTELPISTNLAKLKKERRQDFETSKPSRKRISEKSTPKCYLRNRFVHHTNSCRSKFTENSVQKCGRNGKRGCMYTERQKRDAPALLRMVCVHCRGVHAGNHECTPQCQSLCVPVAKATPYARAMRNACAGRSSSSCVTPSLKFNYVSKAVSRSVL